MILYLIPTLDIDECALSSGGCTHDCGNNDGSFTCSCRPGYEFEPGDDSDPTNVGRLCQGIAAFQLNILFPHELSS